ncbi:helix-turn-helix domain-containing protein [Anabaena sp. UHCC 0399]|uniref:helix-turn-helix domain-containing protein n=1 Tax=Anabaena sp. UHCC 0399 TaxID=3110238 RepID=UPI002B201375|nr:helix-turn-helix domain-containing protein [Anabaena sp. UHCC 0399]MEA5566653.1 helix-turn-helix domain-containing protein [Anabaena sp. UHCC 0399]
MSNKWTPQEIETLEEMAESYTPKQIAYRLKRRGYYRSLEGIRKKLHSLGYSVRPTLDNYSCNEVAKVLQVDSGTVAAWVKRGWLKAIKPSVHQYQIKSRDLKRFLQNPPRRIRNLIASLDQQAIRYLVG